MLHQLTARAIIKDWTDGCLSRDKMEHEVTYPFSSSLSVLPLPFLHRHLLSLLSLLPLPFLHRHLLSLLSLPPVPFLHRHLLSLSFYQGFNCLPLPMFRTKIFCINRTLFVFANLHLVTICTFVILTYLFATKGLCVHVHYHLEIYFLCI